MSDVETRADDRCGRRDRPRARDHSTVAEGQSNKEAASTLGISVKTIEAHRANIMRKLHLRSVSDLVRKRDSQ
jgi:DNA-binding CsgD family transcriptional regulator